MIGASGNFLDNFANGAACRLFTPNFAMMAGVTKGCRRERERVKNKPDVMSCFERGVARMQEKRGCEEGASFGGMVVPKKRILKSAIDGVNMCANAVRAGWHIFPHTKSEMRL